MPSEYYRDALKQAQKEFRSCTAKGESPYLPVLDEFVSQEDLLRTVDLGTIQVPLEFVVGTQTDGRTQAFARNFMPLMGRSRSLPSSGKSCASPSWRRASGTPSPPMST